MNKNFSVLKFLSQVFTIYGITTGLLNIFCILFGASAREFSTIFSLGNSGIGVKTSFQFFIVLTIITALKFIFMTDLLIKKMPLAARIIAMFLGVFVTIIIFILAFDWFPANLPLAWAMFIICFTVNTTVSTAISVMAEKNENRRLDEALKRYKEEQ